MLGFFLVVALLYVFFSYYFALNDFLFWSCPPPPRTSDGPPHTENSLKTIRSVGLSARRNNLVIFLCYRWLQSGPAMILDFPFVELRKKHISQPPIPSAATRSPPAFRKIRRILDSFIYFLCLMNLFDVVAGDYQCVLQHF